MKEIIKKLMRIIMHFFIKEEVRIVFDDLESNNINKAVYIEGNETSCINKMIMLAQQVIEIVDINPSKGIYKLIYVCDANKAHEFGNIIQKHKYIESLVKDTFFSFKSFHIHCSEANANGSAVMVLIDNQNDIAAFDNMIQGIAKYEAKYNIKINMIKVSSIEKIDFKVIDFLLSRKSNHVIGDILIVD